MGEQIFSSNQIQNRDFKHFFTIFFRGDSSPLHDNIFELSKLVENHAQGVFHIESYFNEHKINTYSYPVVVIADLPNYHGSLNIVSGEEKIPRFFQHKSKQLNAKENAKFNLLKIRQTHLNNLQKIEFEPVLQEYARTHRVIFEKYRENKFYEDLLKTLETQDES